MEDIAVLDGVVLALEPELAGVARARLAVQRNVVVVGDGLGADEAFSKSVWMTPAASGARASRRTVQAFASFGPTVKKVTRSSASSGQRFFGTQSVSVKMCSRMPFASMSLKSVGTVSKSPARSAFTMLEQTRPV